MAPVTFGDNLRRILTLRGLRPAHLADAAGVTPVAVNDWLNAENPKLQTLFRIAMAVTKAHRASDPGAAPCCIEALCEGQEPQYEATLRADVSLDRFQYLMHRIPERSLRTLMDLAELFAQVPGDGPEDATGGPEPPQ
jgi:transcriptional regulator with XRE-family HTH domain